MLGPSFRTDSPDYGNLSNDGQGGTFDGDSFYATDEAASLVLEPRGDSLNPIVVQRQASGSGSLYDTMPKAEYYRSSGRHEETASSHTRPSIAKLIQKGDNFGAVDTDFSQIIPVDKPAAVPPEELGYKFGWIEGVYVRCTLSIFGVIMFLRLNWIMAQAGIAGGLGIIVYSTTVTTVTTMSLSAISTNGAVPAGGIYYMVSRQLGAEVGVVVGLCLFTSQSFAVAMNLVGVAESIVNLQDDYIVSADWDPKIWGFVGLFFVICVSFCGASMEIQLQKGLFIVMAIAIVNFFIGCLFFGDDDSMDATGPNSQNLADNAMGTYSSGESWVTVFGVFFPAVTGIVAGSSISGDLKNPSEAIPKGTFLAIGTTSTVYILMAIVLVASFTPSGLGNITTQIDAIDISLVPALGVAGIFAAGLSSALALLIGAPRILMALARDDLLSFLAPLKKGYTNRDEPLRGYVLVVTIAFFAILFLDLNKVNPIVTNFSLLQYCAINLAVASAEMSRTPGWRPSFRFFHPAIAVFGCVLSAASMFMVNYIVAFCTFVVAAALYSYVHFYKPNSKNWGVSSQAARHMVAVKAMYELERTASHVKNFRPQYLVLTQDLDSEPDLVIAMKLLRKSHGVMIAGKVIYGDLLSDYEKYREAVESTTLRRLGVKGFNSVVMAPNLYQGVSALLQISGLGKLKANTVLLGMKRSWKEASEESNDQYVDVIRMCLMTGFGVGVVKNMSLDRSSSGTDNLPVTIDVWWFVEDGGLTLLIAYLLLKHPSYRNRDAALRLFIVTPAETQDAEKDRMTTLLERFRIEASVHPVVVDNSAPSEKVYSQFKVYSGLDEEGMQDKRVIYFMRLADVMEAQSSSASLVVASLPVPRRGIAVSRYLCQLDCLIGDRPTILVRGNQETVLTYDL